jgi:hypothetical protein
MKTIGKWLYLIGLFIAAIAGLFSFQNMWVALILVIMGILAAIFFLDSEDLVNLGIRFLVLFAVKDALNGISAVGPYITGFFNGVYAFLAPVLLTLLVVHFIKKYFKM